MFNFSHEDELLIDRYGVFILPDNETRILIGRIFGHTSINEGDIAHTSPMQVIDFISGWAITRNSIYRLGERLPDIDIEIAAMIVALAEALKCGLDEIQFVPPEPASSSQN